LVHPAAQSVPAGQWPGPAGPAGAALIDHACGGRRTERSSHAQRRQQSGRRHPRYRQTLFARQDPPILDRPDGARRTTRASLEPRRCNSRLRPPRWTCICSRFHCRAIEAPVPDAVSRTGRAMNDQFLQHVSPPPPIAISYVDRPRHWTF
jgi:hypothetical protein